MPPTPAKKNSASVSGAPYSPHLAHTAARTFQTTSTTSMTLEIRSDSAVISPGTRAYFQDRLRGRLYDLVTSEVEKYIGRGGTRAALAKRIEKRPEQITRWLSGPGNLTLDTVSDLLLGLSGAELAIALEYPTEEKRGPRRLPQALLDVRGGSQQRSLTTTSPVKATVAIENQPTLVSTTVTTDPVLYSEVLK